VEEAAAKIVRRHDTTEPEPELVEKYEKGYQKFKTLYPALKEFYRI
jgi:xylulokinase